MIGKSGLSRQVVRRHQYQLDVDIYLSFCIKIDIFLDMLWINNFHTLGILSRGASPCILSFSLSVVRWICLVGRSTSRQSWTRWQWQSYPDISYRVDAVHLPPYTIMVSRLLINYNPNYFHHREPVSQSFPQNDKRKECAVHFQKLPLHLT